MSEDWKAGDVAVCVDGSPCTCPCHVGQPYPVPFGRACRVEDVLIEWGDLGLRFVGISPKPHLAFHATRFRKLRPADPEFIEQLAATKRPVRAEERVS